MSKQMSNITNEKCNLTLHIQPLLMISQVAKLGEDDNTITEG